MVPHSQTLSRLKGENSHNEGLNLCFYIINESMKSNRKQIIHLNYDIGVLSFLNKCEKVMKTIEASRISSFHLSRKEPRTIFLNYDMNKKEEIVFLDIKSRLLFESAISTLIFPEILDTNSNFIIQEEFKIFISTWNVGFSEPNPELENIWLSKAIGSDILVFGLQECKISTWLESLQNIFQKKGFRCISVVSMWRVQFLLK